MNEPPTAKIEAFRRQENPDCDAIRDFLCGLIETLKKSTRFIKDAREFTELRM